MPFPLFNKYNIWNVIIDIVIKKLFGVDLIENFVTKIVNLKKKLYQKN
jgi:hypothetical protein